MDAIRLLTEDHKRVKALFHEYEQVSEKDPQRGHWIVEQVFCELEVHTKVEEEFFYPALAAKADEEGQDLVRESYEEHHVIDVLMGEMRRLEPDNPEYSAKFQVMMENVEHHADEEEKELFPTARKLLGDQLASMGEHMERRKETLAAAMG